MESRARDGIKEDMEDSESGLDLMESVMNAHSVNTLITGQTGARNALLERTPKSQELQMLV